MGILKLGANLLLLFVLALLLFLPAGIVYGLSSTTKLHVLGAQSVNIIPYQKKYIPDERVWVKNLSYNKTTSSDLLTYVRSSGGNQKYGVYEITNLMNSPVTLQFTYPTEIIGPQAKQAVYLLECPRNIVQCNSYLLYNSDHKMDSAKTLDLVLQPAEPTEIRIETRELSGSDLNVYNSSFILSFTVQ